MRRRGLVVGRDATDGAPVRQDDRRSPATGCSPARQGVAFRPRPEGPSAAIGGDAMGFKITICSPVGTKKSFKCRTDKNGAFAESSAPEKKPKEAEGISTVAIYGKLLTPKDTSIAGALTFNGKKAAFKKTKAGTSVKIGEFDLKDTNQFSIEGTTDPAKPDTELTFEVEIAPCT
jgi:hypothetical protein